MSRKVSLRADIQKRKETGSDISICGFDRMDVDTGHVYSTEMTQFAGKVIDMDKNPEDILSINKHRLNKAQLTNEYLEAGDVNKDGKVDIKDLLQINKFRLGKIDTL